MTDCAAAPRAGRTVLPLCTGVALFAAMGTAIADDVTFAAEYDKHLRERSSVTSYGDSPFGEVISLGTGGLEFVQTAVSLPGNSAVPVRIGRRFRPGNFAYSSGHFGSWHLDIPSVHGVFAFGAVGWAASDFDTSTRCSDFSAPPVQSFQGGLFAPGEYWSGTYFYVPG